LRRAGARCPGGTAVGVILSLVMLIYRASHPHGAVLGQLPGTEAYRDAKRHPETLTFPGLLIWRGSGDLFFASIGRFDDGLRAALAASRPPSKHVFVAPASGTIRSSAVASPILPSEIWIKLGIGPRRSCSVCIFTADLVERKSAQGNSDRHRSIVVLSRA
jgi:hypothetical protein